MRIYFTTIVWLLAVRGSLPSEVKNNGESLNTPCKSATVDQTSYTGDSVSFTCKYSQADKNSIRHFCRLDGNNSCSNIISAQFSNYTKLAKFSLSDDKQRGLYQVNISMVTQQDSGKYWCALKKDDFITCLQEVVLHVLNPVTVQTYPEKGESPPPPPIPPPLVKTRSVKESECGSGSDCGPTPGMIGGIVCGVVIVVVLAIVLILCRRKLCNRQGETSEQMTNTIQSPEGKDRDPQYEEIQIQNQPTNTVSTLYSTVNPPADQLHYASVDIQGGDPPTGTEQNASANPPAVTTLYSTVKTPGE
ncbi:CMRF35-like molecule 6 [Gambusia affinis]|uniref:CMRF35-like molecule 6 n=1 Tax=Gambusia affinis TaxID=33528 RepID=UPI001CDC4977|nr:CMRF35-like molecule 6 [Gambusia affinis]